MKSWRWQRLVTVCYTAKYSRLTDFRLGIDNKLLVIICCLKGESRKLEEREGYLEDVRHAFDTATGIFIG